MFNPYELSAAESSAKRYKRERDEERKRRARDFKEYAEMFQVVLDLHQPVHSALPYVHCSSGCGNWDEPDSYPCDTAKALGVTSAEGYFDRTRDTEGA